MKPFFGLFLAFLVTSCYEQTCNCNDFKTGTFEFVQVVNGKKEVTTFVRQKDIQIEYYKGKTDTASVRWINNCEFILTNLHPKNRQEKKAIAMKILSTQQNLYTFEYFFVGENKKQIGTATKIKH